MLSQLDKEIIRALQEGLPLVSRPFLALAEKLGISEEELLVKVRDFVEQGIIRRFGAAVRHQDLGYVSNAMVVWQVPEERIEEVGRLMASFDEVSHCYQRPARLPDWPYNLFTVVHGQTREECREIAARLSRASGVANYRLLFSIAELKKSSMKYFVEK
ncbi:siroheme decarboxylase subunit beta [Desulfofundulus thermosubterraneus]|uniref:siroheme decarboxylase n=1 Tax=Desulfofundulus thermosubterraneus DSM 16057 TaxID=1121432 RepID=A0A1M6L7M8_9FIRM|nr:AsnC family transcriptional regulator [Desulfofundulus thermosubterraneus]SHJ67154.1 transcriptional regulator, AsnC family [Desulfofundulus thermosubterraneus DSM 16057]